MTSFGTGAVQEVLAYMSMKVPAALYGATMQAYRNTSLGCEEQLV